MKIPFAVPDIGEGEIADVVSVLRSGWITTGQKTKEFEKQLSQFCHTEQTVCLNSATAALELTLRILGIGPGDEVIVPAYTYTASASVVCHVGATLRLMDTAPNSFQIDYDRLADFINEKTKAVILVDLGGIMCEYSRALDVIRSKEGQFHPENRIQEALGRVALVADAAHALGATRGEQRCGQAADFTAFSFHAVKNLTTGEGGAVTWNTIPGISNEKLYEYFQLLASHGQSRSTFEKERTGNWEYDVIAPYYKCNMTDICAALGAAQLRRYPANLERRHTIIRRYGESLGSLDLILPEHLDGGVSSGHLYLVRLRGKDERERNELISMLAEQGVATNVHYKPLPMLTAYRQLGFCPGDFPNAVAAYQNEISLPLHTGLNDEMVDYISKSLHTVLQG